MYELNEEIPTYSNYYYEWKEWKEYSERKLNTTPTSLPNYDEWDGYYPEENPTEQQY